VRDLMVFCPNGAQGDSPGQRPGFDGPESFQALKGRNLSARQPIGYRTQGGVSLCPGFDGPESYQALKGRNLSARQPLRYRT
jgi:hypothetical protein